MESSVSISLKDYKKLEKDSFEYLALKSNKAVKITVINDQKNLKTTTTYISTTEAIKSIKSEYERIFALDVELRKAKDKEIEILKIEIENLKKNKYEEAQELLNKKDNYIDDLINKAYALRDENEELKIKLSEKTTIPVQEQEAPQPKKRGLFSSWF